jgi:hypothetical protein
VPFAKPVSAFEQPWQVRLQAPSQQKLSLQNPAVHSLAALQLAPLAFFGAQLPAAQ